jgi:hypothetical protein
MVLLPGLLLASAENGNMRPLGPSPHNPSLGFIPSSGIQHYLLVGAGDRKVPPSRDYPSQAPIYKLDNAGAIRKHPILKRSLCSSF